MPKRRTERAAPGRPSPTRRPARAIRDDLGTTILVEASAGTGKTGSLVDSAWSRSSRPGTANVDHLSAVTFTIRAAAQLRQRFQNSLEDGAPRREGARRAART